MNAETMNWVGNAWRVLGELCKISFLFYVPLKILFVSKFSNYQNTSHRA